MKRYFAWWGLTWDTGRSPERNGGVEEVAHHAFGDVDVLFRTGTTVGQEDAARQSVYLDRPNGSRIFEGPTAKRDATAWWKATAKAAADDWKARRAAYRQSLSATSSVIRPLLNDSILVCVSYYTPVMAKIGETVFHTTRRYSQTTASKHLPAFRTLLGYNSDYVHAIPTFFRGLVEGLFDPLGIVYPEMVDPHQADYDAWEAAQQAGTEKRSWEQYCDDQRALSRVWRRRPEVRAWLQQMEELRGAGWAPGEAQRSTTAAEREWLERQPAFRDQFQMSLDHVAALALNWPQDWLQSIMALPPATDLIIERFQRLGVDWYPGMPVEPMEGEP